MRLACEHVHEGHPLTTIEIDGREAWLAAQVVEGLGYEKSDQVVTSVTGPLADDEDVDYTVLRGDRLAAFKAAAPGLVDPRAPSLMLLFESGIHLVAMRARTDRARSWRRWLASEVLPSIRRTGTYRAPAPSTTPSLVDLAMQMSRAGDSGEEIEHVLRLVAPGRRRVAGPRRPRASDAVLDYLRREAVLQEGRWIATVSLRELSRQLGYHYGTIGAARNKLVADGRIEAATVFSEETSSFFYRYVVPTWAR